MKNKLEKYDIEPIKELRKMVNVSAKEITDYLENFSEKQGYEGLKKLKKGISEAEVEDKIVPDKDISKDARDIAIDIEKKEIKKEYVQDDENDDMPMDKEEVEKPEDEDDEEKVEESTLTEAGKIYDVVKDIKAKTYKDKDTTIYSGENLMIVKSSGGKVMVKLVDEDNKPWSKVEYEMSFDKKFLKNLKEK